MMMMMRAVKIIDGDVAATNDSLRQLKVELVACPAATADRVLVRVYAAGLNRADLLQRRGLYPAPPGAPADIPGLEFAGEVVDVGDDARMWSAGARVFGITAGGAQAEYIVAPESTLASVPANLSWTEAAAVPEAFITAHDALFTQAKLGMGERTLVHAAGSGVGLAAIQLARAAGAFVAGTARTEDKLERARGYGLGEAIVVGDGTSDFAARVKEWSGGDAGVNVVLDTVGANYLAGNIACLAVRGRLVLIGTMGGSRAALDFSAVMRKRLQIMGTVLRARTVEEKAAATRLFAAHVVPLLASGAVQPVVDSVYDLKDVNAAYERLESNQTFGKVILKIS